MEQKELYKCWVFQRSVHYCDEPIALSESSRLLETMPGSLVCKSDRIGRTGAHSGSDTHHPVHGICVHQGRWTVVAWLMVIQIGFNLYPILHLRWARVRINRLQSRILSGRKSAA